jgi:hypothetical protein
MLLRIRIEPAQPPIATPHEVSGYGVRPLSFLASFGLHCIAVVILCLIPAGGNVREKPVYADVIQPQAQKIIWYDFRTPLPEVTAAQKLGTFPTPRGTELSKQAIVAASPSAKSDKQFIWLPSPKIEIREDLPVPNLIARANVTLPQPPAPANEKLERPAVKGVQSVQSNSSPPEPKGDLNHARETPNDAAPLKPRKAFVPPPQKTEQARSPVVPSMLDTPTLDPSAVSSSRMRPQLPDALKPRKAFVLPPRETQQPRPPAAVSLPDAPLADPAAAGSLTIRSSLPAGIGAPALSKGSAPLSNGPPAAHPTAGSGNANVDIAIAGLHAADRLSGPLPEGSRPGRFSKAPTVGEAASGDVSGSASLTVPDLSIRGSTSKSLRVPEATTKRTAVLYSEKVRSIPVSTLSVPLRPSSRTIPGTIDARFRGRSVYTMVVPIENLPAYGGDWILWFAERDQKPGDTPSMRAPVPFRKLEPVDSMLSRNRTEWRLQIAAVIRRDGKVDGISLLRHWSSAVEQAVIQDLESWEFKPATRAGMPVDVDVVIEIPFLLTGEVAKRADP